MIVAMSSEARPLVRYFNLLLQESTPFPLYTNSNENLQLTVSGIGKRRAFDALKYLTQLPKYADDSAWINIGIAGHKNLPLGKCVLAHTVIDDSSGQKYHPILPADLPFPAVVVKTVADPVNDYPDDCAYDMEAAGFYSFIRHHPSIPIQIVKIISDNSYYPTRTISNKFVTQLITNTLPQIDHLIQGLLQNEELSHHAHHF